MSFRIGLCKIKIPHPLPLSQEGWPVRGWSEGLDPFLSYGVLHQQWRGDALWKFTKADNRMHYTFTIGKNYGVGDAEIGSDLIVTTIIKEFEKLVLIYRLLLQKL